MKSGFFFFAYLSDLRKSDSWITRRELRIGTKNLAFCQTPRGRKFS